MQDEIVYGVHAVKNALVATPNRITTLYILSSKRKDKRIVECVTIAENEQLNMKFVDQHELASFIDLNLNHQGILALCLAVQQYGDKDLPALLASAKHPPLVLILDQVQDPHNLGACLRNANAMGVDFIIAPERNAASLTATAKKVASGAAAFTPYVQVTNLVRTLKWLQNEGVWLVGMDADAQAPLAEIDCTGPIGLIMGSEGKGMRRLTKECCDYLAKIDMIGQVESMNVSAATAIGLYEISRQRNNNG